MITADNANVTADNSNVTADQIDNSALPFPMSVNPASNPATTAAFAGAASNRGRLLFRNQLDYDESGALGGRHFTDLRFTSESLYFDKKTDKSAEITGRRGTRDLIFQTLNAMGSVSGEFSPDTYDWAIEAALGGSWVLAGNTSTVANGVLSRAFLMEKAMLDVVQFQQHFGMEIDTLTLTLDAESTAKIDIAFMGSACVLATVSLDGAPLARTTTPVIQTGLSVANLLINGNPGMSNIKSLKLEIKNNLRTRPLINRTFSAQHGQGDFDVTLTVVGYFKDQTTLSAFVSNAPLSLSFDLGTAGLGFVYSFNIPILKIPTDTTPISGRNADVMENFTLNGLEDANGLVMSVVKKTAGF